MNSSFHHVSFYKSVADMQDLPSNSKVEVAFAGRSNAGKSSVINTLTNRNRLAYVSKKPGRTQLINFFKVTTECEEKFLVDLPGYGYAEVPQAVREKWCSLLNNYLQRRESLQGLVLIMDVRHPLKSLDMEMLDWFLPTGKPIHILLTKADKLSKLRANETLKEVKSFFQNSIYSRCSVQLFSSTIPLGVEDVYEILDRWFSFEGSSKITNGHIINNEDNAPL
ncbi:ribosome biogenesis GTP-binding protein YihA/YsxC [Nitrosomonas sp. PY1]|uniref:ribosome biogenesis GTP-binding protein YihA/YsxC n=1 Tax=Nitrosomonas sp. PY1 TaxID=1803906 RepID=UPI001FC89555|nr:ribosome biogenesis GTP-binding protein YihA/YsxC [Nitrosomonas sp. PY1]